MVIIMKSLNNKTLDKCMKTILEHQTENNFWSDDELFALCKDLQFTSAVRALEADNNLSVTYDFSGIRGITVTGKGLTYFAVKKEKQRDFIKSFFSQFFTGFLSGVAVTFVCNLLINYFSQNN